MRFGELLALQWGDIHWNERFKLRQRRRVDMTQLAEALLAWRGIQRTRWLKKGEAMPEVGVPVAERHASGGT